MNRVRAKSHSKTLKFNLLNIFTWSRVHTEPKRKEPNKLKNTKPKNDCSWVDDLRLFRGESFDGFGMRRSWKVNLNFFLFLLAPSIHLKLNSLVIYHHAVIATYKQI